MIIDLPLALIPRASENYWLETTTASAGRGLDGREQVVGSENRRWVGRIDFVRRTQSDINALIILGDQVNGRRNMIRVGVSNLMTLRDQGSDAIFYNDLGVPDAYVAQGHIPFAGGTKFSSGAGFALPKRGEPVAMGSYPAGATRIRIGGFIGRNITASAVFSIDDSMYRVTSNYDGVIDFAPPLRAAVSAGDVVQVSNPTFLARLAKDDGWRPEIKHGRFSDSLSVNLVEAFER